MIGYRILFTAPGKAKLLPFDIPPLGDDEVLLESDYDVISAGTERANLVGLPNTGTSANGFPIELGYSASGRVVDVGKNVVGLYFGDRVLITWGGHRSHVVKKADTVIKINDFGVDQLDAAFAHIASFALLGVRKLRIELGETTMVAGMGILGAFAVQFVQLCGAIPVLVVDLDPVRRDLALDLGATAVFSPDREDFIDQIKAATGGGGPNTVVEVTGSAFALQQALEYIAWEGRISLLGCTRISDVPIDFYKYVHCRGITIVGSHTFTRAKLESAPCRWTEQDDYRTFLKLVAAGKVKTRPLISEIVSPEAAPAIYARLAETKNPPLGIVFDWSKIK